MNLFKARNALSTSLMEETPTTLAKEIIASVTSGNIDFETANNLAQQLQERGRELLRDLLADHVTSPDSTAEVIVSLAKALEESTLGRELLLVNLLVNTFYHFVVVLWYQCTLGAETQKRNARGWISEVVDAITKVLNVLCPHLPKNRAIETRLRLRCIEEVQKILETKTFCDTWVRRLHDLYNTSDKRHIWRLLVNSMDDERQPVEEWYYDVHNMHMLSIFVNCCEDFNGCMNEKIKEFCEKGGKQTVGLALVYMDIIMDDKKREDLHQRAFHGCDDIPGLKGLLNLDLRGARRQLGKVVKLFSGKVSEGFDPFFKTRRLVADLLFRIHMNGEGPSEAFKYESLQVIKARFTLLKNGVKKSEKRKLEETMVKLQHIRETNDDFVAVKKFVASSKAGEQGPGSKEPTEEMKKSMAAKKKVEEEYEATMQELNMHHEFESLEKIFEKINEKSDCNC